MPPDLQNVRDELPCLAREVYLNAGAAGPMPVCVAEAAGGGLRRALARGRMSLAAYRETMAEAEALRAAAGRVVGAPADEIALTGNTTAGLDTVIWGMEWRAGDEVVTTGLEHPGLSVPLRTLARRAGVRLRAIPAEEAHGDLEAAVARRAGSRTRLVALSHVAWTTGARLDVAGAGRAARAAGALTLVDGAQSAGAIPVDVAALGVDAYAFPAQKWLLGPDGLGALWVRRGAMERIDLSFAGYESGTGHGADGRLTPHAGARRYETSTAPAALVPGWRAGLDWLERLGWDWVHGRVAEAQAGARARLEAIDGVEVTTPAGAQAGLLSFTVRGRDAVAASDALAADGVIVRWLGDPPVLRASLGFYTDDADLDRLAGAVREVAA